jgi:WXG100 family type VII secretion target
MASIRVTSGQLRAKATELSNMNAQLKQNVSTLNDTETSLTGMWEGEAKTAFHSAFQKDKVQMDNFYNAIAQYITVLQNVAAKYEQAESQNTEIANTRSY